MITTLQRLLTRTRLRLRWDAPILVFHHLPKTGGSTVNNVLAQWCRRVRDYPERVDPDDWTKGHQYPEPLDLGELKPDACLTGHWDRAGAYLAERYPEVLESDRYRVFTVLREPLEAKLSLLHWERRQGKTFGPGELERALLERPNYMARRLDPDPSPDVLRRYWFVGMTGELQRSMNLLADHLDLPRVEVGRANVSRRGDERGKLSSSLVEAFREANALDYALWRRAKERTEKHGGLRSGVPRMP